MATKQVKPHALFQVWSPDEVAECLEGIGNTGIYEKIWNKIVPIYDKWPKSEVPDDFSRRCLAKWWDLFTYEERIKLNAAAALHDQKNA